MSSTIDQFNQDELEAPAWMNADFFTEVLQSSEKDDTIRVTHVKLSPGSMKGDHYASVMFRATVDYEATCDGSARRLHQSSMIIKSTPDEQGTKKDLLHESPLFETEIEMYRKVLPKFEAILRQVGEEVVLAPRCLYHSLLPRKVIIFEDIAPHGYQTVRNRQANLEEAKLAYCKLAKFHAVSYKLIQEDPAFFDKFRYNVMDIAQNEMPAFFKSAMSHFVTVLETQPALIKYKTYFEALAPVLLDRCGASLNEYRIQPQTNTFYVLSHGDFHTRNMMFKRSSEGQLDDVILLDYQLCHVGPMPVDFVYSVYMLLDKELRDQHLDELMYYYFCNFTVTLRQLDYVGRVPRMLDFRRMLLQHKDLEILVLMCFVPMLHAILDGDCDIEKGLNCTDYRQKMYLRKSYLNELEEVLPKYLHCGYLDN